MKSKLLSAIVEIRPDAEQFIRESKAAGKKAGDAVEKELDKATTEAGKKAGKNVGDGVEAGAKKGAKDAGDTIDRELDGAGARVEKQWGSRFDRMGQMGTKMTVGVTLPMVALGAKAYDVFGQAEDASAALVINYGEGAAELEKFAVTAAGKFGASKLDVRNAANELAPLIGQWKSGAEAADTAAEAIGRAADMASMFGGTTQEANAAMSSFLSGSSVEPIRRYGVFASETSIKVKALEMGLVTADVSQAKVAKTADTLRVAQEKAAEALKKSGQGSSEYTTALANVGTAEEAAAKALAGKMPELTEAQKIQARYALVLEKTSKAEGDFGRSIKADTAMATRKKTMAELTNAAEDMGKKLAPALTKVMKSVGDLATKFTNLSPGMQQLVIKLGLAAAAAGPILKVVSVFAKMASGMRSAAQAAVALIARLNGVAAANAAVTASEGGGGPGGAVKGLKGAGGLRAALGTSVGAAGLGTTVAVGAAAAAAGYGAGSAINSNIGRLYGSDRRISDNLGDMFVRNFMDDGGVWQGQGSGHTPGMLAPGELVLPTHKMGVTEALSSVGVSTGITKAELGDLLQTYTRPIVIQAPGVNPRELAAEIDALSRGDRARVVRTAGVSI